jgi:hypothetical protein
MPSLKNGSPASKADDFQLRAFLAPHLMPRLARSHLPRIRKRPVVPLFQRPR